MIAMPPQLRFGWLGTGLQDLQLASHKEQGLVDWLCKQAQPEMRCGGKLIDRMPCTSPAI